MTFGIDSRLTSRFVWPMSLFAKLRKAAINCAMSVHPSGTTRLPLDGFSSNLILLVFFSSKNYVEKIQVALKSDKNNACFT